MKPAIRRISQSLAAIYSLTGLIGFAEVAQAEVTQDNTAGSTTIVTPNGDEFDITGGVEAGDNLIHSFDQFSLGSDQSAIFNVDANIQNILSRVTGGNLSQINGLIEVLGGTGSTNLFLMNPAGIVFGQGASLNVPGDFTATTATSIGLDSGWFNATGPIDTSQLAGTPNNYFAFDTSEPGAIINSADLEVQNGNLTLIGGTVASEGTLSAPNGQITLATVPGDSIVRLTQPGMVLSLDIERPAYSGSDPIPLTDIPALITGGNYIQNATTLAVENGQVVLSGSGIQSGDVVATDAITASTGININSNRSITTAKLDTSNSDQDSAGSISLFAQRDVTTGELNANDNGDGSAGDVTLYVSEQGNITTGDIRVQNQSEGDAGDVTISTDDGNIDIKNIFAQNHAPTSRPGGSSSVVLSTDTGSITIEGNIRVKNDAVNQQNPGVTHGTVEYYNPEPPASNSNIDPNSPSYDPNIIQPDGVAPEKLDSHFTPATPPQSLITENLPPINNPKDTGGGQPDTGGGQPDTGGGQPDTGGGQPDTGGGQPDTGGGQPDTGGGQTGTGGGQTGTGGGQTGTGGGQTGTGGGQTGTGGEQTIDIDDDVFVSGGTNDDDNLTDGDAADSGDVLDSGENSGDTNPGGETASGENLGDTNPGGETASGENSGDTNPGGETASGDNLGDGTPGGETASGGNSGDGTPGGETASGGNSGEVNPGEETASGGNSGEVNPGEETASGDNLGDGTPGEETASGGNSGEVNPGGETRSVPKMRPNFSRRLGFLGVSVSLMFCFRPTCEPIPILRSSRRASIE
ncbi:two-partner secretion domain-containing protein, partial [Coleofasciculus chthonoplastes]|uniref:two-partner secretion domain-containing protein n=1 Tax=Coleofasciculus chthonoplastes TaxID=64178 RepID=UPI0032F9EB11